MSLRFKAVLFDVDDTLCDTGSLHKQAFLATFEKFGIQVSQFNYESYKGLRTEHVFMRFTENLELVKLMSKFKREAFGELSEDTRASEGSLEILSFLQTSNVVIAAVSSGSYGSVLSSLRNARLIEFIDHVFTQEDFIHQKPDPYPYIYARKQLNMKRGECLIVEDSEAGVSSGLASQMKTALVSKHLPSWAIDLDLIHVHTLDDLKGLVIYEI